MSRSSCPHLLTVALLLSTLVGAAFFAVGCKASDKPGAAIANGASDDDLGEPDEYEPDLATASANYETIAERDVFRPLVVNRRDAAGGESGGEAGGGGATGSPKSASPAAGTEPPKPPDPTADIALTGIIETTDGLEVLLENIKTGEGHFAAVGETVFGLQVIEVGPGTVALKQADKDYELKLGEKEIAKETVASASSSGESTPSAPSGASDGASASTPGGMPNLMGMSSEDRRAAWENMSEEQRNAMREQMRARYGGGRGGPGGGGRGGRGGGR